MVEIKSIFTIVSKEGHGIRFLLLDLGSGQCNVSIHFHVMMFVLSFIYLFIYLFISEAR